MSDAGTIDGHWHAADRAARRPATLTVTGTGEAPSCRVASHDGEPLHAGDGPVSITDRLGNVERRLGFADGSVFVTADNDGVDAAFADRNRAARWVHRLESSAPWIATALIVTVLFAVLLLRYGVPLASERIAHALPDRAGEIVSGSTMEFLDRWAFEPSALDEASREAIRTRMRERLLPLDARNDGIRYRLLFRDWTMGDEPIPNALALPSGEIVLTDAFVALCETDDEMDAVILHEIGHVVERHSLQRIVQATFVGALAMLVTGDGSAFADAGVGLGSLLVSSHYSRNHETEADRYAFDRMLQAGIDPGAFGDIMARMSEAFEPPADEDPDAPERDAPDRDAPDRDGVLDYVASHPASADRVALARRYSECFRRGQTRCAVD